MILLHDWFDWSNAGVGVGGLLLTIGALWQATGAKDAARKAKQAIFRRNAADDIRRLEKIAAALLTAIDGEQYDLASHQARQFISECLDVREHHRLRLGADGAKLDLAFNLVRRISRGIQVGTAQIDLVDSTQRVVGEMTRLAGILSRSFEEEER